MNAELLSRLCCPGTHQSLAVADPALCGRINARIQSGGLRNSGGVLIGEKLDSGLVRADRKILYPIRNHLPVLLVEEAIPLAGI